MTIQNYSYVYVSIDKILIEINFVIVNRFRKTLFKIKSFNYEFDDCLIKQCFKCLQSRFNSVKN